MQTIKDDLKDVKGDVKGLQVKIRRLDEKIDSGLARLDEKIDSKHSEAVGFFKRLDEKIDSLHNEINIRFEAMDEKIEDKIESRDRFTALEAKVANLAAQINSR